jgi:radical SAM protein with 4Fe4S-binding SPASM domain
MLTELDRAERTRFETVNGNVVVDPFSGRKVVLDDRGVRMFAMWRSANSNADFTAALSRAFLLPPKEASSAATRFHTLIVQGQRCLGSQLPGKDHAVLEPTAACNGQCPHCYHGERSSRWDDEHTANVLDALTAAGVKSVSITGGEVFSAHFTERFFELADRLRERNVHIGSVSTNATFLSEEIRDRVLRTLDRTTVLRISMDALDSDLLDRVRPGYRNLPDPYFPIRDLDRAGYPLVFTTNIWAQPTDAIVAIGDYLRGFDHVVHWNVRLAVPVHFGAGDSTRTAARRRQLFQLAPGPKAPLRVFEALLRAHADRPYSFGVRMGNYLTTSLLRNPNALTGYDQGHPCREDRSLVTLKADGATTQCPILPELMPELVMTGEPGRELLWPGFEKSLPLADLDTADMPCGTCHLRRVCGGGCRLYGIAYESALDGCDLPAKEFLEWQLRDDSGLLREHWPRYHERLLEVAGEEAVRCAKA